MTLLPTNVFDSIFPTNVLDDLNEIFFRDFFKTDDQFSRLYDVAKRDIGYPVDIIKNDDSLELNIATVGLEKKDINISVDGDILKIFYEKTEEEKGKKEKEYLHKGITRKAFNLGFKIYPKYDLSKINAGMDKGILTITIPVSKDQVEKKIEIN
jgi:HSP20 family protein